MTQSSFYGDTPNYATSYPTQNDSNTQPVNGNTKAPSSFYPNGTQYQTLANSDTLTATFNADIATANAAANTATTQASNASSSASAAATSAANAANAVQNAAGTATPLVDGTAAVGTSTKWAHEDHVHPTDTSRAPLASPTFTGTPAAPTPTAGDNSTKLATTAFVATSYAPLASPALTGTPTAPTATAGTSTAQLATTAFVGTATSTLAPLASPALTGTPTAPTAATGTNTTQIATTAFVNSEAVRYDASQSLTATQQNTAQNNLALAAIMRSYLAGLTLSTAGSSTTFSVAAGVAVDSTNVDMLTLSAAISKTTATWAVGTGNGALDTGAIAASTWYHVWLIKRTDTQVVDVLVSLSATTPTMPASYTEKRRIGAMKTDASSKWLAFAQYGDDFIWASVINEINTATPATTLTTLSLVGVPPGVSTRVLVRALYNNSGAAGEVIIMSGDETVGLDGDSNARNRTIEVAVAAVAAAWQGELRTNASAQIKYQSSANGTAFNIQTIGYSDSRGRFA